MSVERNKGRDYCISFITGSEKRRLGPMMRNVLKLAVQSAALRLGCELLDYSFEGKFVAIRVRSESDDLILRLIIEIKRTSSVISGKAFWGQPHNMLYSHFFDSKEISS